MWRNNCNLTILSIVIFAMISCSGSTTRNQVENMNNENKDSVIIGEPKQLFAEDIYNNTIDKVAMVLSYKGGILCSQGSGFFVDKNLLVTNYHCVEGADKVELKVTGDNNIIKGAKVIKASRDYDLAIIQTKQDLPFVKIDSLNYDKIGAKVYAIGNPRGLEGSISDGILSGKRENEGIEYLQITAPINPGNSGGPVLNEKGEVIGVATFTYKNSQNLNFAMPIKYIGKCIDISKMVPAETIKKGNKNNAVIMSDFIKETFGNDAYFTMKNNTDDYLKNIYYVIIYKNSKGEIIHYYEDLIREEIAPHLAKRFEAQGFGDWNYYYCNTDASCYPQAKKLKVEFRLISYEIE